jgi:hypothetical protein
VIDDRLAGFAVALGLAGEPPDGIDEATVASSFAPVDGVGLAGDLVEEDEAEAGGAQIEAEVPTCAGAPAKLAGGQNLAAGFGPWDDAMAGGNQVRDDRVFNDRIGLN